MSESFSPDPAKSVSVAEIVNGTRCSPLTLKEFEEFLIHEVSSFSGINARFETEFRKKKLMR